MEKQISAWTGEVLRAAIGRPHQKNLFRELPELRLWGAVYLWWLAIIASLILVPGWPLAILVAAVIVAVPFVVMSVRSRSIELGVYAVVAWIFHAAALPLGFFQPRRKPTDWIESKVLREP